MRFPDRVPVRLFNDGQFSACNRIIRETENTGENRGELELLGKLSEGYFHWDRFEYRKAYDVLSNVEMSPVLLKWRIKNNFLKNRRALFQIINGSLPFKLVDIFANAKRRAFLEKRYDDAALRVRMACGDGSPVQFGSFDKKKFKVLMSEAERSLKKSIKNFGYLLEMVGFPRITGTG